MFNGNLTFYMKRKPNKSRKRELTASNSSVRPTKLDKSEKSYGLDKYEKSLISNMEGGRIPTRNFSLTLLAITVRNESFGPRMTKVKAAGKTPFWLSPILATYTRYFPLNAIDAFNLTHEGRGERGRRGTSCRMRILVILRVLYTSNQMNGQKFAMNCQNCNNHQERGGPPRRVIRLLSK
jgi:hypothetical protein